MKSSCINESDRYVLMHDITIRQRIDSVIAWSQDVGVEMGFDAKFIFDLEVEYLEMGRLTEDQNRSLNNIIVTWMICLEDYL